MGDVLVSQVTICALQHSRMDSTSGRRHSTDDPIPLYLNAAEDLMHNCTAGVEAVTQWEIVLADIPIINMAGVDRLEICTTPTSDVTSISDTSFHFILKVLRAMKEVGSFHIAGHSGNVDMYSLVHRSLGALPWRELETEISEEIDEMQYKQNYELLKFTGGKVEFSRYTREYLSAYRQQARDYFDFAESLCDFLLHVLALGAALATSAKDADTWRWVWKDDMREMSLNTSTYYPGKALMNPVSPC